MAADPIVDPRQQLSTDNLIAKQNSQPPPPPPTLPFFATRNNQIHQKKGSPSTPIPFQGLSLGVVTDPLAETAETK